MNERIIREILGRSGYFSGSGVLQLANFLVLWETFMSFPLLAVKSFATLYAKNRIKETTFKMGGSLVSSFCILGQKFLKKFSFSICLILACSKVIEWAHFPFVLYIHAVKFSNEQRIDEIFEKLKKTFFKDTFRIEV